MQDIMTDSNSLNAVALLSSGLDANNPLIMIDTELMAVGDDRISGCVTGGGAEILRTFGLVKDDCNHFEAA
jgi:hypothetical protein